MNDLPEINLAKRLIERKKLKPRVDVFELAKQFATVEIAELPVNVDGVSLNLKQRGKRPRIIVNADRIDTRIRFTLAHELGHVLIPWHTGMIVDEIDISGRDISHGYWALEAEANRFAAELLMPTEWVVSKIRKLPEPLDVTNIVAERADVSFQAATIKVLNCLPNGFIFAQIENGVVKASGRSFGTLANQPKVGSIIEQPDVQFPWNPPSRLQIGAAYYYWWKFGDGVVLPPASNKEWREILDEILGDINVSSGEVARVKSKLNGIVAYANGSIRQNRTAEKVFEACLERLHSNDAPIIRTILAHPKFAAFLGAKVSSMMND